MSWLSQRLHELLEENGLSIQKVARELGIESAYAEPDHSRFEDTFRGLTRKLAAYFDEDEEEWAFGQRPSLSWRTSGGGTRT